MREIIEEVIEELKEDILEAHEMIKKHHDHSARRAYWQRRIDLYLDEIARWQHDYPSVTPSSPEILTEGYDYYTR